MNTPTTHPDDLLPWYVNGTLTGNELAEVEAHLSQCDQCQQELEFLQLMREQVKAAGQVSKAGDLAKRRLMNQIKQDSSGKAKRSWVMPLLAAAACLVILIQAGLLISRPGGPDSTDPKIHLQSKAGPDFRIQFNSKASMADISKLLQSVDAEIISGPTPVDHYYEVRLLPHTKKVGKAELKIKVNKIIADLKSKSDIVKNIWPTK